MVNISIEQLQEIEDERENIQSDPKFQNWIKELNVSRLFSNPELFDQSKEMMKHYNYSTYTYKV